MGEAFEMGGLASGGRQGLRTQTPFLLSIKTCGGAIP